jgi:hypothetical protein
MVVVLLAEVPALLGTHGAPLMPVFTFAAMHLVLLADVAATAYAAQDPFEKTGHD